MKKSKCEGKFYYPCSDPVENYEESAEVLSKVPLDFSAMQNDDFSCFSGEPRLPFDVNKFLSHVPPENLTELSEEIKKVLKHDPASENVKNDAEPVKYHLRDLFKDIWALISKYFKGEEK
jgi:hypothetical protein